MPFQYSDYRGSPAAGSIAELMLRRGEIAAQQANAVANAQARAAEVGGQAWAGAAGQIGQSIAAIPQQLQQQKEQALRAQIGQQQLAGGAIDLKEKQKKLEDDETMARIYQGAYGQAPSQQPGFQGPTQAGMPQAGASGAGADGLPLGMVKGANGVVTIKPDYLTSAMAQAGMGDKIPGVLAGLSAYQEKAASLAKLQGEVAVQQRDALGSLGATVEAAGNSPSAFHMAALMAIHNGQITTEQIKPYLDQVDQNPAMVGAITKQLQSGSPKQTELNSAALTAKSRQQTADTGSQRLTADLPKIAAETQVAQQNANGTQPITPYQQAELKNRGAALAVEQGKFGLDQKKFAQTQTAQTDNPVAKAIAEYRVPPPAARSLSTPGGQALMSQVMALNPDYSADMFSRRAPLARAFTSGPQSQAINSLNTAIGHLDQFVDVAKALDNGSFRPGNEAFNWLKATFGDSAPTNFEGIRSIMSGELASAFKKSGATDQEIASVEKAIASKNSTGQLVDYATKIAIPALGSKISTYNAQYSSVMGARDPFKVLTPDAESVLTKYGFDPAHPRMGGSAPPPASGGGMIEAIDPQGVVHHAPAGTALPAGWKLKG